MDSTTMINDMVRKRFATEPLDQRHPDAWPRNAAILTECLTALSNKMHSRHLGEISWKGQLTQEHVLCYAALWVELGKAPGPCPFHIVHFTIIFF